MKQTIQILKDKVIGYATTFTLMLSVVAFVSFVPPLYARMFGQFLSISAYMVLALISFYVLTRDYPCLTKALLGLLRGNGDKFREWVSHKKAIAILFIFLGSTAKFLGCVSQVYANQVAAKPVLIHFGNPLLCIVLLWIVTNKLNNDDK